MPITPYFKTTTPLSQVYALHGDREDLPDALSSIKTGGRIIGKRKASGSLIFLDLESSGETLQIMLDASKVEDFSSIKLACQRGAIVGIEGYPGRTQAGEFTVMATGFSLLAECPQNLPVMNQTHKKILKDSEKRFSQRSLDFIVN